MRSTPSIFVFPATLLATSSSFVSIISMITTTLFTVVTIPAVPPLVTAFVTQDPVVFVSIPLSALPVTIVFTSFFLYFVVPAQLALMWLVLLDPPPLFPLFNRGSNGTVFFLLIGESSYCFIWRSSTWCIHRKDLYVSINGYRYFLSFTFIGTYLTSVALPREIGWLYKNCAPPNIDNFFACLSSFILYTYLN